MKSIIRRIQRLEARSLRTCEPEFADLRGAARWRKSGRCPAVKLRFGHLRRLPGDYQRERHVVIAQQLPDRDGQEWVEFAEVPGPPPAVPPPDPRRMQFNIIFV